MDINKVFIIGRLTRDPELSMGKGNTMYCRFSIAVNGMNDNVNFFNIVSFGKTAELVNEYCCKGKQIAIDGELSQSRWEKDGKTFSKIEVVARRVQFLGNKNNGNSSSSPKNLPNPTHLPDNEPKFNKELDNFVEPDLSEDEIPFG